MLHLAPNGYAMQYPMVHPQAGQFPHVVYTQVPLENPSYTVNDAPEPTKESCKKSWCKRSDQSGCCWKDDGRAFGSFTHFLVSAFLGTVAPLFSLMIVFGFETSKLARTGALFGTANFFLIVAASIVAVVNHLIFSKTEYITHHDVKNAHIAAGVSLILGLIIVVIAIRSWKRFLFHYRTRETKKEHEVVDVISNVGSCKEYALSMLISVVFPIIGTAIVIIVRRRYLQGRFGALIGLGVYFVSQGIVQAFQAVPPFGIFVGLFLLELTAIHFKRAIICAEKTQSALPSTV
jgi:hypothetical protein